MPKFAKRYVLGVGVPISRGSVHGLAVGVCEFPLAVGRYEPLHWPLCLDRVDVPRYRLVLERVEADED